MSYNLLADKYVCRTNKYPKHYITTQIVKKILKILKTAFRRLMASEDIINYFLAKNGYIIPTNKTITLYPSL